ncbi:hypothetical protein [Alteribacillus bidgolensis]|uniref:Uncharacterized protein n=1 Tax=Alteribacillus bidgolensis TaxID=930129 RepID=A0A1G8QRE3_9BACI|nr:hypothetical protein [Alteribacillus bidgolensis]SDJ07282.1 hypothetical protein SAMN05216352_12148 [Alteribacillus bidgolensis]
MGKLSKLIKLANDPKVKKLIRQGKEKGIPMIKKELEKRQNRSK